MKRVCESFLFFNICLLSSFIGNHNLYAQTEVDSISIYFDAIWYPNQSKLSINSAIKFYENKIDEFLNERDTINAIEAMETIIQAYSEKGEHYMAEEKIAKTQALLDKILEQDIPAATLFKLENTQRNLYHRLGILYKMYNDSDSAIKYYNKALQMSLSFEDSISLMNNVALIYKDEKDYHRADSILRIIYDKVLPIDNYNWKWTVLDNLGYVQSKLDRPNAIENMEFALNMNLKNKRPLRSVFSSYRHLAIHYIDRNQNALADSYIQKASKIADSLDPDFIKEALSLKMRIHEDPNVRSFLKISDSLGLIRQKSENIYATKKYSLEKSKKESAQNKLLAQRRQSQTILAIIGIIVTFVVSVILYFYYKQRNKFEKDQERHQTERKLSKKVHDEVGNDIFYLMTQIQSNPTIFLEQKGLKVLDGLNAIYGKARDISNEYTSVNTGAEFNEELLTLLNSYGNDDTKIVTNELPSDFWKQVSNIKKEEVFRILQELLTNMKKHSEASFVGVTFSRREHNIIIKYADNGKGVSLKTFKPHNGLSNVETRIESIKGTITFDSSIDNGFKAEIQFRV